MTRIIMTSDISHILCTNVEVYLNKIIENFESFYQIKCVEFRVYLVRKICKNFRFLSLFIKIISTRA